MLGLLKLHEFAAERGEGLIPELIELPAGDHCPPTTRLLKLTYQERMSLRFVR